MSGEIGAQVKTAAYWTYARTFFLTFLQFLSGVWLARILGPADFGVFIAASAFTAVLARMVNFGLPQALVYEEEVKPEAFNAAFWLMFIVAFVCFAVIVSASPWLRQYYHDDRFSTILLLMTITFFFIPYVAPNNAILLRKMEFRTLNLISIKAVVYDLPVTIVLALLGFGPFSLVAGGVASQVMTTFMFWRKTRWLPGWPHLKPVKGLVPYAFKTNMNNMQDVLSERIDNMLVGALIGTSPLGIYNRAFSLARLPVEQLAQNLQPVLFSGMARIQEDLVQTRQIYHKALCGLSLAVFPFLAIFWLAAEDFISFLYGEAWMPAVTPLRIMSLGSAASLITLSFRSVSAAQDLIGKEAWVHLTGLILLVVMVVSLAPWGVAAVAAGVSIKELIVALIFQRVISRSHLGFSWRSLLRAIAPATVGTLVTGLVVGALYASLPQISWLRLVCMGLLFLGIYFLFIKLLAHLWAGHEELTSVLELLDSIIHKILGLQYLRRMGR